MPNTTDTPLNKPLLAQAAKLGAATLCVLLTAPAAANNLVSQEGQQNYVLWGIISLLLALQTLLIIGLQRSRLNNKRARKALKQSQKELEQRISERTATLEITNLKLQDEIIRHEATVLLLRETQDYLHSILNAMPSVIIGVTHNGAITHWNTAAESSTGISAELALGRALKEVYPSKLITCELIEKTIAGGIPFTKENMQEGQGSEAHYTDLTIYPLIAAQGIGAVIRLDDVTARVKIEHMMIQNEKMFSLGELAAGIAHEINNPIGAILHSVQNIYRRTSPVFEKNRQVTAQLGIDIQKIHEYLQVREIYRFLEDIKEAGERSAKIVTNMLEFSHSSHPNPGLIDLKSVIEHSIELSINTDVPKESRAKPVSIIKELSNDLPTVVGSAPELQQVILNLLRNARQALASPNYPAPDTPTITVRARQQARNIVIEVMDNGPGMSEEIKNHIFEPFYTTKEVGKGTGLGLSVSYFIVTEHHNGKIQVDSKLGQGTCFTIMLPLPDDSQNAPETLHQQQ